MGRAEDLFARLVQNGEAEVEEFFNSRQSEELFLDFKRSADEGKGRSIHSNDLNNLAKAISGFGNSEGGIIVWGVDCNDKDKSNTGDLSQARKYIEDPQRFRSRLEGSVSGRTVPSHPGVLHHSIPADTGNNEGYVVTYVPKSNLRPHQAIGTNHYYIRAGSDFVPTPHGVLAGMFGQHPQPVTALAASMQFCRFERKGTELKSPYAVARASPTNTRPDDVAFATLLLGLESHGPGLTKDLYMTINLPIPGKNSRIDATTGKKAHEKQEDWTIARGLNREISVVSTSGYRLAPAASVYPLHIECMFRPPFEYDFSYGITYGFQGSPVQTAYVTVDRHLIVECWKLLVEGVSEPKDFAHVVLGLEQLGAAYRVKTL